MARGKDMLIERFPFCRCQFFRIIETDRDMVRIQNTRSHNNGTRERATTGFIDTCNRCNSTNHQIGFKEIVGLMGHATLKINSIDRQLVQAARTNHYVGEGVAYSIPAVQSQA